jgi:transposase
VSRRRSPASRSFRQQAGHPSDEPQKVAAFTSEWVAAFGSESVAAFASESVAGFARNPQPGVATGKRGGSVGMGRTLSPEQETAIQKLICDRTPDQLKMPYALWTRSAVGELVAQQFGVKLPVRTVGHYLKRWGFTPQKPIRKAYEQRPAEVKAWLGKDYPAIAVRAKTEGAEIHWGDETGLRSDDVRGRCYAPKGQTPVVEVCRNRESLSLISAVTNQGKVRWMVFGGALNAKILIGFFKRLIRDAQRKVFLILDNLRVHHARVVREWLEAHRESLEVFYLPSYSPELNPDECLNADLKQAVTSKAPARTKGQLKQVTLSHLRKLSKSPLRIQKYFQHAPVRYAA